MNANAQNRPEDFAAKSRESQKRIKAEFFPRIDVISGQLPL
jgi:hypothetical protein